MNEDDFSYISELLLEKVSKTEEICKSMDCGKCEVKGKCDKLKRIISASDDVCIESIGPYMPSIDEYVDVAILISQIYNHIVGGSDSQEEPFLKKLKEYAREEHMKDFIKDEIRLRTGGTEW